MEKFEVNYNRDSGDGIYLEDDGKVRYSTWDFEGVAGGYPDDKPDFWVKSPFSSFLSTLHSVAKLHPEVYAAVYKHIKSRTEPEYAELRKHCKEKADELVRKIQIIE